MYRTVTQIESAIQTLAAWFPQYFTRIQLPETSIEGRTIHALRLRAGDGEDRRGVLIIGGTHSRELMNPDAIVELAVDLLVSHVNGTDITYGGRVWPADQIRVILETLDLWLFPCINPDGREHVLNVDDMWRKNLRDNPGTNCEGVDLNRNLDMLHAVTEGSISCNPCSDVFCGPSAFSEPETRNVKFLLENNRIDCFVDVHSFSELILYPWGHAPPQTTDPTQRFTGLPSGTCAEIADPTYAEYMTPRDEQRFQTVAQRIVDAIQPVRGRTYSPQTSVSLYPTTGTFSDYVYSRHIADPALRKTYAFTFETGPFVGNAADSFHPADPEPVKLDAKSGLIALVQQCICAIELIGGSFLGGDREADVLRRVRDDALATTEAGRAWVGAFEQAQFPALEVVLGDEELTREATGLVKRASEIIEQNEPLEPDDVARASRFVSAVAERVYDRDAARAIELIRERLPRLEGRQATDIVENLMEAPPTEPKR